MKRFFKLTKLSQRGIVHHLAPIFVVILLGGITAGFIFIHGKAATPWNGALQVGPSGSGFCLSAPKLASGQSVVIDRCTSIINQKWTLISYGTYTSTSSNKTFRAYQIKSFASGVNLCLDQSFLTQGKNTLLKLNTCNSTSSPSSNLSEQFYWAGDGHQLRNTNDGECLDNKGAVLKALNPVNLYQCKTTGTSNQDWFEIGNSANATSPVKQPVNPTAGPNPASNGGTTGGGGGACDFAAVHDACESELNAGAGTGSFGGAGTPSSDNPTSNPPANPATPASPPSNGSMQSDFTAVLEALQQSDPSFQCSSLSDPSNVAACDSVFNQ